MSGLAGSFPPLGGFARSPNIAPGEDGQDRRRRAAAPSLHRGPPPGLPDRRYTASAIASSNWEL
jgi:hypothetical protein